LVLWGKTAPAGGPHCAGESCRMGIAMLHLDHA
jgi:hypothetical protein